MVAEGVSGNEPDSAPAMPAARRGFIRPLRRGGVHASRFVAAMKLLLPALALLLIALVVVWPNLLPDQSKFRLGESARESGAALDGLEMERPRYVGVDENARPYQITADMARQQSESSTELLLSSPKADIVMSGDAWVALTAASGVYDREAERIDLSGGVTVFHDAGYEFSSKTARVDLANGVASGTDPVEGHGEAGSITGEGFEITDEGARVLFVGKSRMVIRSRKPALGRGKS